MLFNRLHKSILRECRTLRSLLSRCSLSRRRCPLITSPLNYGPVHLTPPNSLKTPIPQRYYPYYRCRVSAPDAGETVRICSSNRVSLPGPQTRSAPDLISAALWKKVSPTTPFLQ